MYFGKGVDMKLVRFGKKGSEKPGIIDADGCIRDLSMHLDDLWGENVSKEKLSKLNSIDLKTLPLIPVNSRIGSCLKDAPNFYCIGLNYTNHAKETDMPIPKEPILFSKATSAISGPFDNVFIPQNSKKTDWEVELGVIIGENCHHVSKDEALSYISGYCTINDISEREFQFDRGGQWIKGKSAPTFAPIGPHLVTSDEILNPQDLDLELIVNGNIMQKSNTSDMIFSVAEIISHLSQFMVLRIGDIIATGTPEGVGMGLKPPVYLKAGDIMEIEVEKCGRQIQEVKA